MLEVEGLAYYWLQAYFRLWFSNPLNPIIIDILGVKFDSHFGAKTVDDGLHEDRDAELLAPVDEDHGVTGDDYRALNLI